MLDGKVNDKRGCQRVHGFQSKVMKVLGDVAAHCKRYVLRCFVLSLRRLVTSACICGLA